MTIPRLYFRILAFAIPLILALVVFHLIDKAIVKNHWQSNMQLSTLQMKEKLMAYVENVVADVLIIATDQTQTQWIAEGQLDALESRFISLSQYKNQYAQIRYIDATGLERLRVDNHNGEPVVIQHDQLQDKSSRYYFQNAHSLPFGSLYISKLDLNMEQGEIEHPIRPMMRFAAPVVDRAGQHYGVVIINYRMGDLLKLFDMPLLEDSGQLLLLNSQGHWLAGGDPDQRWGNMFDHQHSFAEERPRSWSYIKTRLDQEQFKWQADDHIYAATLYREEDAIKSLAKSVSQTTVKTEEPWLVVVSETTPEKMFAGAYQRLMIGGLLVLILIVIWAFSMNFQRKLKIKKRLAQAQAKRMTQIVEQTSDFIFMTDLDGKIDYVNPAFCHITGYKKHQLLSKSPSLLKSGHHLQSYYQKLWKTIKAGKSFRGMMINRRKDDSLLYEEKTITPMVNALGEIEGFVSIGKDITHSEITQNAFRDPLTGLVNRALFMERLTHEIELSKRTGANLALLYLDLDCFKQVNDKLGHQAGDDLLVGFAKLCQSLVRKTDTVSRLGGDEFVILMTGYQQKSDVATLADNVIKRAASADWFPADCEARFGVSIGIHTFTPNKADLSAKQFLELADRAMYASKKAGKNQYAFASDTIEDAN